VKVGKFIWSTWSTIISTWGSDRVELGDFRGGLDQIVNLWISHISKQYLFRFNIPDVDS
jgi:hypothetical protein